MSGDTKRIALQIILGIVIVVLSYVLYVSITEPYQEVRAQQRMTERVRDRMNLTRTALIRYRDQHGRFPGTLDSLAMFVDQNPDLRAELDSTAGIQNFTPDSLLQSPRTGEPFEYALNDTSAVKIYRLRAPGSDDQIGTLKPDVTMVNAANWE